MSLRRHVRMASKANHCPLGAASATQRPFEQMRSGACLDTWYRRSSGAPQRGTMIWRMNERLCKEASRLSKPILLSNLISTYESSSGPLQTFPMYLK